MNLSFISPDSEGELPFPFTGIKQSTSGRRGRQFHINPNHISSPALESKTVFLHWGNSTLWDVASIVQHIGDKYSLFAFRKE
jgi:hypothetical protein